MWLYLPGQRPPLLRSFSRLEEVQLRDLSSQIGSEWEKFATFLGLSAIEVYQIKLSHIDAQDRVFEVLIRWQRKMSRNTNMVRTLAKALEDSGRVDLKEKLLEEAGKFRFARYVAWISLLFVRIWILTMIVNCDNWNMSIMSMRQAWGRVWDSLVQGALISLCDTDSPQ